MVYNTQEDWEREYLKDKIFLGEDDFSYLSEAKIINDDDKQVEATIREGFRYESSYAADLPAEWGPSNRTDRQPKDSELVTDTGT